ncbi:MAG: SxtJ family membrane protein [bacterium]
MLTEIITDIKKIKPKKKDLRNFGLLFFGILTFISLLFLRKHNPNSYWIGGIGLFFLFMGLLLPNYLYLLYKLWTSISVVMGFFMIRIILIAIFFIAFTPVGIVLRLMKKDILKQNIDKKAKSYWIKREKQPFDRQQYEKLF